MVTKRGQAIARMTSIAARKKGKLITTTLYPGPRPLDRETPFDWYLIDVNLCTATIARRGNGWVEFGVELRNTETLFRQAAAPFAMQPASKAIADCYWLGLRRCLARPSLHWIRPWRRRPPDEAVPAVLLAAAKSSYSGILWEAPSRAARRRLS